MARETIVDVPLALNTMREVVFKGDRVRGALGPADFPTKVSIEARTDEGGGNRRLVVRFVYALHTDEPLETISRNGDLKIDLLVGTRSRRLFGFEAPMPEGAADFGRLRLVIAKAKRADSVRQAAHYAAMADSVLPWVQKQRAADGGESVPPSG